MRRLLAAIAAAALLALSPACLAATSLVSPIQAYVPVITALASWSSGTSINATQNLYTPTSNAAPPAVTVQIVTDSGTFSTGQINFQVTYDGTHWGNVAANQVLDPTSATLAEISMPYTLASSTNKPFMILPHGAQGLRLILSTAITGSGTITTASSSTVLPLLNVVQIDPSTLTLPQGAATSGQTGSLIFGAVTSAAPSYTTAQSNPLSLDLLGNLRVLATQNPASTGCDGMPQSAMHYTPINLTASGQIITGTSGKQTYICHVKLILPDNAVALVEGTGTVCATSIAGMAGGTTAATGLVFNNSTIPGVGFEEGNGASSTMATATTGDNVCLIVASSTQVSGSVKWYQN